MPRLRFEQLLGLYRNVDWDKNGDEGTLTLVTPEQLADLQFIENDETAGEDANLVVLTDPSMLAVGQAVRLRISSPRIGLGLLARSFEDFLKMPGARISEPPAYFIVDGRIEPDTSPTPATIAAYRKVLGVVALFTKAAAFLDETRQELVFVNEGKVVVPVRYNSAALNRVSQSSIDALIEIFNGDLHQDQRLVILENAIVQMVEGNSPTQRFTYLLDNLDALTDTVRKGYRLFASSFSYTKIRGDVEAAKVDYVTKIHKTLIDIQSQLLGIPVATIVVASQMKASQACGVDFWTNVAVLSGAWVFLCLLLISIVNQWATLGAIGADIRSQQQRLERDFAAISSEFVPIFQAMTNRIHWHRSALAIIGFVALVGACFATFAFRELNTAPLTCLTGGQTAGASFVGPSAKPVQVTPGTGAVPAKAGE